MDPSDVRSRPLAAAARRAALAAALLLVPLLAPACGGGEGDGGADGTGAPAEAEADGPGEQEGPEMTEAARYLRYSAADSLVELELYAGLGGANSAWNYNGYYGGNATYVVPLGWRVEVTYETLDANVPHSAAVVETREEIPRTGADVRLAFQGASTPSFTSGLSSTRGAVTFDFRAHEAGRYWLFCGVPGHATGGMWIWFEVSEDADAPELRVEDGDGG